MSVDEKGGRFGPDAAETTVGMIVLIASTAPIMGPVIGSPFEEM